MPKYRIFRTVLALFLIGLIHPAFARNYEVEIIIFERLIDSTVSEQVIHNSKFSQQSKRQHIESIAENTEPFEVNDDVNRLNAVRQQLISSGFRILRAAQWTQPGNFYQNAPIIPLGISDSSLSQAFIRIYKTTLIFADLNLQLSTRLIQDQEIATFDLSVAEPLTTESIHSQTDFYISEKRRLKFKEIHYFDHPKFGAILGVWPDG